MKMLSQNIDLLFNLFKQINKYHATVTIYLFQLFLMPTNKIATTSANFTKVQQISGLVKVVGFDEF